MIFLLKFVFILIEQSVQNFLCRLFYQWIHSLAEPTTSLAKYSGLHFAQYSKFCFQSFSLRYVLKSILKKYFQLVSDLIFLPPSFYFFLRFCSYESTKDKLSLYLIWTFVNRFAGVFRKNFLPPHYNWKVTSRLLGYFTKILQKFFRYNWFFADRNISVFSKNLKHPPYILDICIPVCWGVSLNFFKKSPTIIGNLRLET